MASPNRRNESQSYQSHNQAAIQLGDVTAYVGSTGVAGMPCIFFFFFAVLGLELRAYTLSHSTSPFM
jgi:hypothetical protein